MQLASKFVMVNLEDDEEPDDDKYAPDGRYIPRLYFLGKAEPRLLISERTCRQERRSAARGQ